MAFSVPLCGEPAGPWHWGWKAESVAGLAGNHQDRISLNNLSEAVSSYLSSKSGVCRGAWKSSLLPESPWAHLWQTGAEPGLSVGFSAALTLFPDESLWFWRESSAASMPQPGDCSPGQAAVVRGSRNPEPSFGTISAEMLLASLECQLRKGFSQWQGADQSFSPFPRLKVYFVQADSMTLLKHLAFGKDCQAQLPRIFEHTEERTICWLFTLLCLVLGVSF